MVDSQTRWSPGRAGPRRRPRPGNAAQQPVGRADLVPAQRALGQPAELPGRPGRPGRRRAAAGPAPGRSAASGPRGRGRPSSPVSADSSASLGTAGAAPAGGGIGSPSASRSRTSPTRCRSSDASTSSKDTTTPRRVRLTPVTAAAGWPTGRTRAAGRTSCSICSRDPVLTTARPLAVHVQHELGRLLPVVPEQLLEHERHVRHQVDRVVPDERHPRQRRPDVGALLGVRSRVGRGPGVRSGCHHAAHPPMVARPASRDPDRAARGADWPRYARLVPSTALFTDRYELTMVGRGAGRRHRSTARLRLRGRSPAGCRTAGATAWSPAPGGCSTRCRSLPLRRRRAGRAARVRARRRGDCSTGWPTAGSPATSTATPRASCTSPARRC